MELLVECVLISSSTLSTDLSLLMEAESPLELLFLKESGVAGSTVILGVGMGVSSSFGFSEEAFELSDSLLFVG